MRAAPVSGLAYWIVGSIAGLIGFVGLFLASEGNREGNDLPIGAD
jgi:hypothetical protein